jgi:hypothetical protein
VALQNLDDIGWLRLQEAARDALPDLVRGRGPTHRPGTMRGGSAGGGSWRPQPPSRRLPPAHMGRATFLRLIAGWLVGVAGILALVLAIRWLA